MDSRGANHDEADKGRPVSEFQARANWEIEDNLDEDIELEDADLADLLAESGQLETRDGLPHAVYFTS